MPSEAEYRKRGYSADKAHRRAMSDYYEDVNRSRRAEHEVREHRRKGKRVRKHKRRDPLKQVAHKVSVRVGRTFQAAGGRYD